MSSTTAQSTTIQSDNNYNPKIHASRQCLYLALKCEYWEANTRRAVLTGSATRKGGSVPRQSQKGGSVTWTEWGRYRHPHRQTQKASCHETRHHRCRAKRQRWEKICHSVSLNVISVGRDVIGTFETVKETSVLPKDKVKKGVRGQK